MVGVVDGCVVTPVVGVVIGGGDGVVVSVSPPPSVRKPKLKA